MKGLVVVVSGDRVATVSAGENVFARCDGEWYVVLSGRRHRVDLVVDSVAERQALVDELDLAVARVAGAARQPVAVAS